MWRWKRLQSKMKVCDWKRRVWNKALCPLGLRKTGRVRRVYDGRVPAEMICSLLRYMCLSVHELRVSLRPCDDHVHPDPHGLCWGRHHVVEPVMGFYTEGEGGVWALEYRKNTEKFRTVFMSDSPALMPNYCFLIHPCSETNKVCSCRCQTSGGPLLPISIFIRCLKLKMCGCHMR